MSELQRYFDTIYNRVESKREYGIATLLDPRYKFAGFRSRENATLAKERLIQEMTNANTATTFDTAVLNGGGESDGAQSYEADQLYRKQLKDYLKEKRVLDLSSDPFKYWQEKHVQYHWLANMVRKYHSPQPGSASAERLFSSAKHVLGQTRLAM